MKPGNAQLLSVRLSDQLLERFRYMYYSLSTEKNVRELSEIFRPMAWALGEMRHLRKLDWD